MSINTEFNKFINENITLSQDDISKKVNSRQWVVYKVIAKIEEKTDCPNYAKKEVMSISILVAILKEQRYPQ